MANIKGQHNGHKVISSFSSSWCLRPPSTKNYSSSSPSSSSNSNSKDNKKSNNMSPKTPHEPSSPRVGCMGQIRRGKQSSSGSTDSSSSSRSSPSNIRGQFNLLMIKRVISSKILFVEMDPPRPVEKKTKVPENNSTSLWTRRRCHGGDGIKLQLQTMGQVCA